MAAAILDSNSVDSPWTKIKNEKYVTGDPWILSGGSGWGAGGWDENGGWGSSSSDWGSGADKHGEWGSSERGWGSSGGGWGRGLDTGEDGRKSVGSAWGNDESSSSGSGSRKQPTLTELWTLKNGETSSASASHSDAEGAQSSSTTLRSTSEKDQQVDASTGWGTSTSGWGAASGMGASIWAEAHGGGGAFKTDDDASARENAKDVSSPVIPQLVSSSVPDSSSWPGTIPSDAQTQSYQPGASASISKSSPHLPEVPEPTAYIQSYFATLSDGSSVHCPFPNTYDIRAMWEVNYDGYYNSIDFSATTDVVEQSMDRNLERFYWDIRYQSEISNPSPYIHEMQHLSETHRSLFITRLVHLDSMFSRVEADLSHLQTPSFPPSSSLSRTDFLNQHDRDVKQTVYKALRLLFRQWYGGGDYPSVLDWEGDHSMPYRVGEMIL